MLSANTYKVLKKKGLLTASPAASYRNQPAAGEITALNSPPRRRASRMHIHKKLYRSLLTSIVRACLPPGEIATQSQSGCCT